MSLLKLSMPGQPASLLPRYHAFWTKRPCLVIAYGNDQFDAETDSSVIELLLVRVTRMGDTEIVRDLHTSCHLFDEMLGWNYGKVFADGES